VKRKAIVAGGFLYGSRQRGGRATTLDGKVVHLGYASELEESILHHRIYSCPDATLSCNLRTLFNVGAIASMWMASWSGMGGGEVISVAVVVGHLRGTLLYSRACASLWLGI